MNVGIFDLLYDDEESRLWSGVISLGALLLAGFVYMLLVTEFEIFTTFLCGGYIGLYIFSWLQEIKNKQSTLWY